MMGIVTRCVSLCSVSYLMWRRNKNVMKAKEIEWNAVLKYLICEISFAEINAQIC